jgi:hypothetical protein
MLIGWHYYLIYSKELVMPQSHFRYKVNSTYKCQNGDLVTVLGRTQLKGYETLICSDGVHRYDRSTSDNIDAGRVTGTSHDYSYPLNFERYENHNMVSH